MGAANSQPQDVKILGKMGAADSQPQDVKILGNMGGVSRVAFDDKTGAVSVSTKALMGGSSSQTAFVPNDQLQDLKQYIDFVQTNMKPGVAQNPGVYPMAATTMAFDAIGTQVGAESLSKDLPAVTAWQIKNPPVRAVVYTDKGGVSKFLYKNDPGNVVQLVQNGSKVVAGASQKEGAIATAITGPSSEKVCILKVLGPMLSDEQKNRFDTGMRECMRNDVQMGAPAPAPAPAAAGTSTYAAQGVVYPIQSGGYPLWVVILSLASILAAIVMAKKSG